MTSERKTAPPIPALDRLRPPSSVFLDGPMVILCGPNLIEVAHLLKRGIADTGRRDGISPSPELAGLMGKIARAAEAYRKSMSPCGRGGGDDEMRRAESSPGVAAEALSTADVAVRLGRSPRHVRRLVIELGGRMVGTVWVFDSDTVDNYIRASRPTPRRR